MGPKPATNGSSSHLLASSGGGRETRRGGNDLATVALELLFLVAIHEVDVELVDARRRELVEPQHVLLRLTQDAEAVGHLVAHEGGVARPHLGVMVVVVPGAV